MYNHMSLSPKIIVNNNGNGLTFLSFKTMPSIVKNVKRIRYDTIVVSAVYKSIPISNAITAIKIYLILECNVTTNLAYKSIRWVLK